MDFKETVLGEGLEGLNLGVRIVKTLHTMNVRTVGDLLKCDTGSLKIGRRAAAATQEEIDAALNQLIGEYAIRFFNLRS